MASDAVARVQRGIQAWQSGDFETIEALLDPAAEWHAVEPGDWDCHGRDEVMATLRERHEQGFAAGELEIVEAGPNAVVLVSHPSAIGGPEWPDETATLITLGGDRVVRMRDFATQAEALAAAG